MTWVQQVRDVGYSRYMGIEFPSGAYIKRRLSRVFVQRFVLFSECPFLKITFTRAVYMTGTEALTSHNRTAVFRACDLHMFISERKPCS